jgi:hypothetical protein
MHAVKEWCYQGLKEDSKKELIDEYALKLLITDEERRETIKRLIAELAEKEEQDDKAHSDK